MLNLTPHDIVVELEDGSRVTFPTSGTVARVSVTESVVGEVNGIPVIETVYGDVEGLPEEGTDCIVSAMVRSAIPGRKGVYSPDSGSSALRNDKGHIVAVRRLVKA